MLHALSIALLLSFCSKQNADMFTSTVGLEALLDTHERTIIDLETYINKEEQRLSMLKRYLDVFKREHDKAMADIPSYTQNPISAFTLIKRLTADLSAMNESMQLGQELIKNMTFEHEGFKYPETEDLEGAALAIARLQRTYQLEASDLAEGKINGVAYSSAMNADDCFELGGQLFSDGDLMYAREWMFEALKKYYKEHIRYYFNESDILYHINETCYWIDHPKTAKEWVQKVKDLAPQHPGVEEMLAFYDKLIAANKDSAIREAIIEKYNHTYLKPTNETDTYKHFKAYEALCRGELDIPTEIANRLTCRYMSEHHPFSLIAPFKTEMLYLNPDVVLFHDIISNSEIEALKQASMPKFSRAKVNANGNYSAAKLRISKVAWFDEKESDIVARITRRVTHMTGLSATFADRLQVVNYGIGGHYEPHYDFYNTTTNNTSARDTIKKRGNRFATALFYMTDVALGGATVFPRLGLKMAPVKGTAIMWYNMHASGACDYATKHAACPVLQGSKWVFTKWLRQYGQELIRPCNLENQRTDHHTSKLLPAVTTVLN